MDNTGNVTYLVIFIVAVIILFYAINKGMCQSGSDIAKYWFGGGCIGWLNF